MNKLLDQTGDNIAIVLLYFEHLRFAKTIGDVGAQSDRLPRHVVSSFDAGIQHTRKSKDDLQQRQLGPSVIRLVGKSSQLAGLLSSDPRESIVGCWRSTPGEDTHKGIFGARRCCGKGPQSVEWVSPTE